MKLDALFIVKNGISSSEVAVLSTPGVGRVPFLRPASTQQRTVVGWVAAGSVKAEALYPKETLFVSTNGEGSHTYAYVSDFEFVPNSDVSVLLPVSPMTLQEKLYYARCITMNRYKFSYGRKPKGDRLKAITLPAAAPSWVNSVPVQELSDPTESGLPEKLCLAAWRSFELQELFDIKKGKRLTKANMLPGTTPYIGSTDSRNGITAYVGQAPIHQGNTLTVAYNGSVAETFYQAVPFWATDDVNVSYPKFSMSNAIGLFLCALIRLEKFRFNYGRKWHLDRMKVSTIRLPVDADLEPDWAFMERYIKTLPYSSQLAPAQPV